MPASCPVIDRKASRQWSAIPIALTGMDPPVLMGMDPREFADRDVAAMLNGTDPARFT